MQADTTYPVESTAGATRSSTQTLGLNVPALLMVIGGISFIYLLSRMYLHEFAFTVGLDYFEPEFAQYWMTLFWFQIAAVTLTLFAVVVYLWKTRELSPHKVTPEDRAQSLFRLCGVVDGLHAGDPDRRRASGRKRCGLASGGHSGYRFHADPYCAVLPVHTGRGHHRRRFLSVRQDSAANAR